MKNYILILGIVVAIFGGTYLGQKNHESQNSNVLAGSVGNIPNKATTTDAAWDVVRIPTRFKVLKTGTGWLSNVVITGATTATGLNFYDATTTNRIDAAYSTTSIGVINVSTPAGTYTFDAAFNRGLLVEFPTAAGAASSTITWN